MLIRIVRLTLQPDATKSFEELFQAAAPKIRQMQGCKRLELWVDSTSTNIFTTYSEWESESSLKSYRESDLFKETWAEVKPLFAAPAMAHSYYLAQLNR
ncbi:MAG: antibiotic biosynthesis monooxygenase [Rhodothermaceae bacterium]|nr:antibiotic biosynthesis monooxygenase [Rhodothermaceae bacterium]MYG69891.1 antibiotic biosynthesis monooxygenase [Rhodothermaceae bacterium]MYJ45191.1 antibiotic biosynthesis monooxygenase [Rhodothermaceae bacterium]